MTPRPPTCSGEAAAEPDPISASWPSRISVSCSAILALFAARLIGWVLLMCGCPRPAPPGAIRLDLPSIIPADAAGSPGSLSATAWNILSRAWSSLASSAGSAFMSSSILALQRSEWPMAVTPPLLMFKHPGQRSVKPYFSKHPRDRYTLLGAHTGSGSTRGGSRSSGTFSTCTGARMWMRRSSLPGPFG